MNRRSYEELVNLAKTCARQSHVTSAPDVRRQLWQMALEYQAQAGQLGPLPDIGKPPPGVQNGDIG